LNWRINKNVVVILIGLIIAFTITIAGWFVKLEPADNLILNVVVQAFMLHIVNYVEAQKAKGLKALENLKGGKRILKRALSMISRAKTEICATWCIPRYDKELEDYYKRVAHLLDKNREVTLRRAINFREVGRERAEAHLLLMGRFLRRRQYIVYSTLHRAFEYIVVDGREALFLVPHAIRKDADFAVYGRQESFVFSWDEAFRELTSQGVNLEIPENVNDDGLRAAIRTWVNSMSSES